MKRQVIHIFNGFPSPYGGSELEALALAEKLRATSTVKLWATSARSSASLCEQHGIERITLARASLLRMGLRRGLSAGSKRDTYIFVGAHWRNKLWPYFLPTPRRLIYVFNTFHPKILSLTSRHPVLLSWPNTEYVFISDFQKTQLGTPGVVHPSPIDIDCFKPEPAIKAANDRIAIGRLSRDSLAKHDPEDLALYRAWAGDGMHVKLQGATCLTPHLEAGAHLELMPEGAMSPAHFLRTLDIFYYRTGTHVETFGRVVVEAMACALPVVCDRRGGYADSIRHGENGFLFDTTDEAQRIVRDLQCDPALRARIGANARKTVEALYSRGELARRAQFYHGHEMAHETD